MSTVLKHYLEMTPTFIMAEWLFLVFLFLKEAYKNLETQMSVVPKKLS